MILASIFVFSLGVSAADGENAEALPPAASAVVTLSLQDGADIVLPPMMVQVTGDVSDVFEYADTIPYTDGVSALDVLIVAHGIAYGQDFLDNPGNYLVISPEGYVTKIYGIDSWGFCYMINGEGGHTDQPSSWGGGFESLLVNQAAVQGGDLGEPAYVKRDFSDRVFDFETPEGAEPKKPEELGFKMRGFGECIYTTDEAHSGKTSLTTTWKYCSSMA